jgi:sporulation integral membrane protein YtvI
MAEKGIRWGRVVLAAGILWLGSKYLFPLLLPFLIGALTAMAAEPAVSFLHRRLKLPRLLSAGVGVTVTLLLAVGLVGALGAVLLRQVTRLADAMPDLEITARQGMTVLSDWLVDLTHRAPEGVQPMLTDTVLRFFNDSNTLVEQVTRRVPGAVATVLGKVPDSALGVGTGLLSAFMISARLPKLKQLFREKLQASGLHRYLPAVKKAKQAALGWLRAQGFLMLLTWLTVSVGFWLLGIRGGILWAGLVALVDAVPMLGTGLILLPWALVSFLQGMRLRALGLCALVGAAALLRTILEPRLVGKELGLDPLVTLICLYAGYRLWGFLGLLLAPMLAGVLFSMFKKE